MASPPLPSECIAGSSNIGYAPNSGSRPVLSVPLVALLTALAYYLGSQIGFLLTPKSSPMALFWPPNAILLAILLLVSRRSWPLLLLAVLPAHLIIQLKTGIPLLASLGWFAGNTSEAVLGALCFRFFSKQRFPFDSVQGVILFVTCCIGVATSLTSFLDAASTIGSGIGSAFWHVWASRLASNTLADITLVPLVLFIGLQGPSFLRKVSRLRLIEALFLFVGLVTVSLAVFGEPHVEHSRAALMFAPIPFCIWAAMRFGAGGLSLSLLLVALISLWNVLHGRGPLLGSQFEDQALAVQTLLTLCGLPLLMLAATTAERQLSEEKERKLRASVIYANERERRCIARKLHDEIVQELSLVGSNIDELLGKPDSPATGAWDEIHQQISSVTLATTKLSHNLHPYTVDYLGLPGALKELCNDFEDTTGIPTKFYADSEIELPVTSSYALYRVASEVLQSMSESEKPDHLSLELRRNTDAIVFRIHVEGEASHLQARVNSALAYLREEMSLAPGTLGTSLTAPHDFQVVAQVALPKITLV